jgi:Domain of unknown function (DUF4070)
MPLIEPRLGIAMDTPRFCNVLMLYPLFVADSFWSFAESCNLMGVRRPAAPLGLITVAAMLPASWTTRLIDCNTETVTSEDIAWADLVFTGGMLSQQADTLRLINLCHSHGKPVVIGGPDATSSPHIYGAADFQVLGEAEGVIGAFIASWECGVRSGVFTAPKFQTDVTKTPVPASIFSTLVTTCMSVCSIRGAVHSLANSATSLSYMDGYRVPRQRRRCSPNSTLSIIWIIAAISTSSTIILSETKRLSIHKIYSAGMLVTAGFIVGFDSEKVSIADAMIEFIEEAAIPVCMVGLLYALPNTQLTRRLSGEGRLHANHDHGPAIGGDQCTAGINFDPLRPLRDILMDYKLVLESIYHPTAYARRLDRLMSMLDRSSQRRDLPAGDIRSKVSALETVRRVVTAIPETHDPFSRTFLNCAKRDPSSARIAVTLIAAYAHLGPFSRRVVEAIDDRLAALINETSVTADLSKGGTPRLQTHQRSQTH